MPSAPLAVAVVSWNTRDLLARCLDSFAATADGGRVDVWVVDNGSTDGSRELVRERYPWVELVEPEENLGFGRAVNLVAERTEAAWIAPANADVALTDGALDVLLDAAGRDTHAGAFAPRLVLPDGSTQHSVFAFPTIPYVVYQSFGLYRLSPRLADRLAIPSYWNSERERRVPWAVAAFVLVRREAWNAVGGFDERQWMYAEDIDLCWRLREAGWATRYVPAARVLHELGSSTKQVFGDHPEPRWQRSTYGFLARRRGIGYTWTVAVLTFLGALLRCAYAAARGVREPRYRAASRAHARWALVQLEALRGKAAVERLN